MAEYTKFRLGEQTLADLDALAVGGSRTQALREAVAYWRLLVAEAGQLNADELAEADWVRLGHLNDPSPLAWTWDEEERAAPHDWSVRLATELEVAWEGRAQEHKAEAKACAKLAHRIAGWGPVRGYALFACLRAFWSRPDTPDRWWEPAVWMAPIP